MDNKPPFVSLELDSTEAEWLVKLLDIARDTSEKRFNEIASISSSDPRARNRATLIMDAGFDNSISENLIERITNQLPSVKE